MDAQVGNRVRSTRLPAGAYIRSTIHTIGIYVYNTKGSSLTTIDWHAWFSFNRRSLLLGCYVYYYNSSYYKRAIGYFLLSNFLYSCFLVLQRMARAGIVLFLKIWKLWYHPWFWWLYDDVMVEAATITWKLHRNSTKWRTLSHHQPFFLSFFFNCQLCMA